MATNAARYRLQVTVEPEKPLVGDTSDQKFLCVAHGSYKVLDLRKMIHAQYKKMYPSESYVITKPCSVRKVNREQAKESMSCLPTTVSLHP